MNRERRGFVVQFSLLAGVVLFTAVVVHSYTNYSSRDQEQGENRQVPQESPQTVGELLSESTRLLAQERYPAAERSLRQVLNLERDNLAALRMLGRVYLHSDRYVEAGNIFRAILAKQPRDPAAHANLGETLIRMQWYEAGIRELLTARSLNPNLPDVDGNLAFAYEQLGNPAAAEHYRKLAAERAAKRSKWPERNHSPRETPVAEKNLPESPEKNHEPN